MPVRRLLLDTAFVQALLNRHDVLHEKAKELLPVVEAASEVLVTEAVLVEIGNAFSRLGASGRSAAAEYVRGCYRTANTRVITVDTRLLSKGVDLYDQRRDKEWGLTDCVSLVVMEEEGLREAVTGDNHFQQAGYVALML